MHACMYTYKHTDDRGFPQKPSLSNFAFFMDENKMWYIPHDCQRQITGGLVLYIIECNLYTVFSEIISAVR